MLAQKSCIVIEIRQMCLSVKEPKGPQQSHVGEASLITQFWHNRVDSFLLCQSLDSEKVTNSKMLKYTEHQNVTHQEEKMWMTCQNIVRNKLLVKTNESLIFGFTQEYFLQSYTVVLFQLQYNIFVSVRGHASRVACKLRT